MAADIVAGLRRRLGTVDWRTAIAIGILAFPAGLLATVVLVALDDARAVDLLGTLVLAGFVFYSALNVGADLSGGGQLDFLAVMANQATPPPVVPIVVYYAIPVFLLVGVGGLTYMRLLGGRLDPIETALAIVGLSIGFGAMALLGSFAFASSTVTGETARISLSDAALFGFLYPLVFGLLGAALVQIVDAFRIGG